jgi:hypothetical protein
MTRPLPATRPRYHHFVNPAAPVITGPANIGELVKFADSRIPCTIVAVGDTTVTIELDGFTNTLPYERTPR